MGVMFRCPHTSDADNKLPSSPLKGSRGRCVFIPVISKITHTHTHTHTLRFPCEVKPAAAAEFTRGHQGSPEVVFLLLGLIGAKELRLN